MISVVLSVYNTGKYLPKAMDALLAQTYTDFEILIVDDGSTDGSAAICEAQAARRPGSRVFHKENGGLSSARNCGIDHARGTYIIFPDPDDWVEPDYLEGLMAIQAQSGADLAVCGHFDHIDGRVRVWNAGAAPEVLHGEAALDRLMRPNAFCGYAWNKLYRLDVIRENALRFDQELGMVQDLHFAVRYFMLCQSVAYDPRPLYHYNHDSGGVTASYSPLTPRKLSCFLTYRKIAELTEASHPHIAALARCSLCHMSLQYIYIYYRTRMNDAATLRLLRQNVLDYQAYYLESDAYTALDKRFIRCVPVSTRLYYLLTHCKKVVTNRLNRRRAKNGK